MVVVVVSVVVAAASVAFAAEAVVVAAFAAVLVMVVYTHTKAQLQVADSTALVVPRSLTFATFALLSARRTPAKKKKTEARSYYSRAIVVRN